MDQGPERGSDFLERRDSRLPPSSLALSPTPTCRRWPVAPLKTKASAGQGRHRSCSLSPQRKESRAKPDQQLSRDRKTKGKKSERKNSSPRRMSLEPREESAGLRACVTWRHCRSSGRRASRPARARRPQGQGSRPPSWWEPARPTVKGKAGSEPSHGRSLVAWRKAVSPGSWASDRSAAGRAFGTRASREAAHVPGLQEPVVD